MMTLPRVALVSSATGAEFAAWTDEWVQSVRKTDYPGEWSIELVDDGGELSGHLKSDLALLEVDKQPSISAAFNLALEAGLKRDPDYVCLLTTSTRPTSKDWLETLVRHIQRHERAAIAGTRNVNPDGSLNHAGMTILRIGEQLMGLHVGRDIERGVGIENLERYVEATTGACMLFTREILDKGVRFDPRIRQNSNDVDVCLQVRALGYEVLYVPDVVLWRDEGHTRRNEKYRGDGAADNRVLSTKWWGRTPPW